MENNNGKGIFLGVVSVATLIVAIIGATFAYFSATTTVGNGVLEGQTLFLFSWDVLSCGLRGGNRGEDKWLPFTQ